MAYDKERLHRAIRQAEGYLELGLPRQAIEGLQSRRALVDQSGRASYLLGESLREVERYAEAIDPLERAADLLPDDMHVRLALAWSYKRVARIDAAIATLEQALRSDPMEAILHYNLACYWSLLRNRCRALRCLTRALDLDGNFIDQIPYEPDFDPLRDDPEFQMLTSVIV